MYQPASAIRTETGTTMPMPQVMRRVHSLRFAPVSWVEAVEDVLAYCSLKLLLMRGARLMLKTVLNESAKSIERLRPIEINWRHRR